MTQPGAWADSLPSKQMERETYGVQAIEPARCALGAAYLPNSSTYVEWRTGCMRVSVFFFAVTLVTVSRLHRAAGPRVEEFAKWEPGGRRRRELVGFRRSGQPCREGLARS